MFPDCREQQTQADPHTNICEFNPGLNQGTNDHYLDPKMTVEPNKNMNWSNLGCMCFKRESES